MAKSRKPPKWQKGSHEYELTLPAPVTESGKDEKVTLGFRWEVRATKPMTDRDWTKREMQYARDLLERASGALARGQGVINDLESAFTHAVTAWCRTHLRGKGAGNEEHHLAFLEKAPEALKAQAAKARAALHGLARGTTGPADAVATVRAAVEALLDAAAHPPKNRRRFPARFKSGRPLHKPRVKPGGWIDTGRYRPALVLSVMADPPHIMMLCYGDEVDDDFRPHTVHWKTVRMRKRPPSLKDVFTAGDWIRHARSGYGRVLVVRDSTMDVAFNEREETLIPDAAMRKIEKVDGPEPEDDRPIGERFPPGTWIQQDSFGTGVVIATGDDTLTVLLSIRIVTIATHGDVPVVWKLDRPPLDLTLPREQRRIWWWRNTALCQGHRPCPCCGYPNLGIGDEFGLEPVQCILCGWTDEWDGEEDADEVTPLPDPENPLDWEWPNWGYSLSEARRNFEIRGVMFRRGDPSAKAFAKVAALRGRL
ncbi:MAG: hypothetical protein ACYSWU_20840, partial [Planctomycetota bacterium]